MQPAARSGHCFAACFVLVVSLCFANAALAKKKLPAHPINLNTASAPELEQVPGIGPSTAAKILQMRKSYGAFKSVNDLLAVKGIGEKRVEKMRKYLTVNKPPPPTKKSTQQPPTVASAPPAKAPPATKATNTPPAHASEDEEP
jgi:competence protein ComEA